MIRLTMYLRIELLFDKQTIKKNLYIHTRTHTHILFYVITRGDCLKFQLKLKPS